MSIKNDARLRRAKSTRAHIRKLGVPRLSVLRTGQHLYAQVFTADGSKVLAAASTTQAEVGEGLKNRNNIEAASKVGQASGAPCAGRSGPAVAGPLDQNCRPPSRAASASALMRPW